MEVVGSHRMLTETLMSVMGRRLGPSLEFLGGEERVKSPPVMGELP